MTKLKIGMVGVVVMAGVVAPWVIQRQAQNRLQGEVQALRLKSEQLDSVLAENGRLSNLVAQTETANPLGQDQLSELLRLRGEVGQLRQQASDLKKLQAENRRLRTAATARPGEGGAADSNVEELNIQLPKASWAFAGYGTPEAALQTMMWARREGDSKSVQASLTPGFMEKAQKAWGDKFDDELRSELPGNLDRVSDCRIMKKEMISDSEVKLMYVLGEQPQAFGDKGEVRAKALGCGITAKRVGDEWKLEP